MLVPPSRWKADTQPTAGAKEDTTPAAVLLLLLICADAAFAVLHQVNVETGWLRGTGISLETDGGPAEIYQYVKEFWILVCMVVAFVSTRRAVYVSWALVFLFLLVDDAAKIHESVGVWLGDRYGFTPPFGLRPDDIGELLFAGAVGLSTFAVVGAAVWRGTEQCRRVSRDLFSLIFVLAVCGVLIDMVHVIAYFGRSLLAQVLLLLEDGGEMIVMSALTAYAFHLASHAGRTDFDLWSFVRTRLSRDARATTSSGTSGKPTHEWDRDSGGRRSA